MGKQKYCKYLVVLDSYTIEVSVNGLGRIAIGKID